jgi:hypothetical protein
MENQNKTNSKLLFRNLNIGFGQIGGAYFIEDDYARVYLTTDDIERIFATYKFNEIRKNVSSIFGEKAKEILAGKSAEDLKIKIHCEPEAISTI